MPVIDDRTPLLNLPLPNKDNTLEDDVARLREGIGLIDTAVSGKQEALGFTPENTAAKAVAGGYASLDGTGKVPTMQLPSFVDDVVEAANFASLPTTGETGKIYVTLDNNKTWRWGGSAYAEISASPGSTDAVPEGASNLYFTPARAVAAIPIASAAVLGGVKIGAGLSIGGDGTLVANAGGGSVMTLQEIAPAGDGLSSVPVPDGYVVGAIMVGLNGSWLAPSDYTAVDGVTIGFVGFTVGTIDSVLVAKLSTVTIGNLTAAAIANAPTGTIAATTVQGAITEIVSDLAASSGSGLVGHVSAGAGAVARTAQAKLRDLVSVADFGAVGDGVADDTASVQAALDVVSAAGGGVVLCERGKTYKVTTMPIVKARVTFDLQGSTIAGTLDGGNLTGLRLRSHAGVQNGTITVTSTGTPGSQGGIHAGITIGPLYGDSPTTGSISPDEGVTGWFVEDIIVSTDKAGRPAIQILGGVNKGSLRRVEVPDSAACSGIHLDWAIVGNVVSSDVPGTRTLFDAGSAYTTHPHNISIADIKIGNLTAATSHGLRLSGVHGISVSDYEVVGSAYAGFFHTAGDLGYEFAPAGIKPNRHKSVSITNFNVLSAKNGWGFFADCYADNVGEAVAAGYSPLLPVIQHLDVIFSNCHTASDAGASTIDGWRLQNMLGGLAVGCSATRHSYGVRFETGLKMFAWEGGRIFANRQDGVVFSGGTKPDGILLLRPVVYGNGTDAVTSNFGINLAGSVRAVVDGAMLGDVLSETTQLRGISADASCAAATLRNNFVRSVKTGGIAYYIGGSTDYLILKLFANNDTTVSVANTYAGANIVPVQLRIAPSTGAVSSVFSAQRTVLTSDLTPTAGTWAVGDTIYYTSPVAGQYIGVTCVAAGTPGTWKFFGAVTA